MAEGATTKSEIRRVAVMFVDFRSLPRASTRTPQEVVDRLDAAFAVLVDILDRHGGIVNKFLGDGFLALFGAPFEAHDGRGIMRWRGARNARGQRARQQGDQLAVAHRHRAFMSVRSSPAISARRGARNTL